MKPNTLNRFLLAAAILGSASFAHAAALTWDITPGDGATITGGTGSWTNGAGNWNSGASNVNWNNATPDSATFGGTPGTVTLGGNITAAGLTVNSNSATAYTFNVGSNTLAVNGNVLIGLNSNASTTKATFTGLGSFLVGDGLANRTFQVGGATSGSVVGDPDNAATIDMSGLSTFSANLGSGGTFRVGDVNGAGDNSNTSSIAILAKTSTITTGTLSVGGETQHGAGGAVQTLKLGDTNNIINAGAINVGVTGTGGRSSGEILFNSGTGALQVRDANGTGRANMSLVSTNQTTSAALAGTVNLTGHSSDLLLGTLEIAVRTGDGAGTATSSFSFDTGTLDVTTITLATRTGNNTAATSTGTVNIGGGTANIGSITMASAATGKTANATINLTGGVTTVAGNISKTTGTGTGTAIINLDGGTLDMTAGSIGGGASNIVTLNAKSGTLQNLSELNSGGALTKSTGGTLRIEGTNAYTGATNVTAGTLLINGTNSSALSAATVDTGATIGGTGSYAGAVSVSGILAPGDAGIESLNTGAVTFANNSTFAYELNSGSLTGDLLDTTGGLNLDPGTVNLTLNDLGSTTLIAGQELTLISYFGTWDGDTFTIGANEILDGETITVGLNQFEFNYDDATGDGGGNNHVTMTVVPEPAVALLGSLGMLALLRRRRD